MFLASASSLAPSIAYSSSQKEINSFLEKEITLEFESKFLASSQKEPVILLIGGFQGSGKSSLIRRIEEIYDANILLNDVIRQTLFNRGLESSLEFTKMVSSINNNLVKKSLTQNANLFIDANAHSKRIQKIEKLVQENRAPHILIKIFLKTSQDNLRDRVKNRKPSLNCYQGTLSNLEAALSTTEINPDDYNLIVDTDSLNKDAVFEKVNDFIYPFFSLQYPAIENNVLYPVLVKDKIFSSFAGQVMNRMKQARLQAKDIVSEVSLEHLTFTTLDRELLEPNRRRFIEGVDRSPEHLPFPFNQFKLESGDLVSASIIELSLLDPVCPNMIAAQGPMPNTLARFWSMVSESHSNFIVMLTDLEEETNIKCTRYWPEKVGDTFSLEGNGTVSLLNEKLLLKDEGEELWHSELLLQKEGIHRKIQHYWLKGWRDGKGLNSLELQDALINFIHQNVKKHPGCPPIIHCSGGVGRTGTLMGEYLAKHLLVWSSLKKEEINKRNLPLEITLFLRFQRSHLLHTLDQNIGLKSYIEFIGKEK